MATNVRGPVGDGALAGARSKDDLDAPGVASRRGYMRNGLPAVYRDGDFTTRFVTAFEMVLDPIVGLLDALPEHFSAEFAPRDILELMAAWVGVGLYETESDDQRREVVRSAAELGRRRGTRAGLELALRLTFPNTPLAVEDCGGVAWATDPAKVDPPDAGFVVSCDEPLPEERVGAIVALIDSYKPVNSTYRLTLKRPPGNKEEGS